MICGSDVTGVVVVVAVKVKTSLSSSLWPSLCLIFVLPLSAMEVCVNGIPLCNQSQSVSQSSESCIFVTSSLCHKNHCKLVQPNIPLESKESCQSKSDSVNQV